MAGTIVGQMTTAPDVKAANCDKANVERNPSGNARGNAHECAFQEFPESDTNPEPIRDCDRNGGSNAAHKNSFKDNDGDTFAGCVTRGDDEH